MTVNHDAVAAFPTIGNPNKTLARNVLVARMPYVLGDSDDSRNLVAVDPSTGAIIVDMVLFGRVFHYDPTDTTTAHDGTSCLVSSDGLRYKLAAGTDVFAYAVLDNTIATPPGSPSLGDAYLVAAGATGAWAGKSNYIAVKTNRGWEFLNFSIGRFVYVESVDTYYHKNAGGSWVTGLGSQTLAANSVPLSAAINFGKRLIVENQTTTAPPGSPTVGTAYIIGASATGGWAGLDGKIAICEVAGSFVIYTPTNGWAAYDKAQNNSFTYNGSAWISSAGAIIRSPATLQTKGSGSTTFFGAGTYSPSTSVAPTTATSVTRDDVGITYAAAKAGARLRFTYAFGTSTGRFQSIGLLIDSNTTAIDWTAPNGTPTFGGPFTVQMFVSAPDTSSHLYRMGYWVNAALDVAPALSFRSFTVEEFS